MPKSWRDYLADGGETSSAHRLILVREQDAQHSGSGCCGRLGEAHTDLGGAADFSHSRSLMEDVGAIYRGVQAGAPELDIDVVDPRNTVWLYPSVWRDARRFGRSVPESFAAMRRAGAAVAVILDGEVLYSGRLPGVAIVVEEVLRRLGAQRLRV